MDVCKPLDVGTLTERWATILLLCFAVAGSFAFTLIVRWGPLYHARHTFHWFTQVRRAPWHSHREH